MYNAAAMTLFGGIRPEQPAQRERFMLEMLGKNSSESLPRDACRWVLAAVEQSSQALLALVS